MSTSFGKMHRLARIVEHPLTAPLFASFLTLVICLAWQNRGITSYPGVADEFCYMLSADTFCHGRLANPPHPLWRSFEQGFVFFQPTYQCKYQPGQPLIMAAGKVLFGSELAGVWLSSVLAAAAVAFYLRQNVSGVWALLGGSFAAVAIACSYWSFTYWGGSLTACGGALTLAAVFNDGTRSFSAWRAVALGVGVSILLLTRPFEGLALILSVAAILTIRVAKAQVDRGAFRSKRLLLALCFPLALTICFQCVYNHSLTGSFWKLAYFNIVYDSVPNFIFLPLDKPVQIDPDLDNLKDLYWEGQKKSYEHKRQPNVWPGKIQFALSQGIRLDEVRFWVVVIIAAALRRKIKVPIYLAATLLALFVWPSNLAVWLVSFVVGCVAQSRGVIPAPIGIPLLVTIFALSLGTFSEPHYGAPVFCICMLLQVKALRFLKKAVPGGTPFPQLAVGLALAVLLWMRVQSFPDVVYGWGSFGNIKQAMTDALIRRGGKHVVFSKNGDYNSADIDASIIVWARLRTDERYNDAVRRYYPDRSIWHISWEKDGMFLVPERPEMGEKIFVPLPKTANQTSN